MKKLKKIFKALGVALYICLGAFVTMIAGCSTLTPTRVPPLTEAFGYKVVNFNGWTLVGINEWAYKIETSKLDTWGVMIDMVNKPALQAREQVIDVWSMIATGGLFGGIPLALRKPPRGYKKPDSSPPSA